MEYFYFPVNRNDILFQNICEALFRVRYRRTARKKINLLYRLRENQYWLMDVVEHPINRSEDWHETDPRYRTSEINRSKIKLLKKLCRLRRARFICGNTRFVLIKHLVFETTTKTLRAAKYCVPQRRPIPFPLGTNYAKAIQGIREISESK